MVAEGLQNALSQHHNKLCPPPSQNSKFLLTNYTQIDHVRDCVWRTSFSNVFENSQFQIVQPSALPHPRSSSLERVYKQELIL